MLSSSAAGMPRALRAAIDSPSAFMPVASSVAVVDVNTFVVAVAVEMTVVVVVAVSVVPVADAVLVVKQSPFELQAVQPVLLPLVPQHFPPRQTPEEQEDEEKQKPPSEVFVEMHWYELSV